MPTPWADPRPFALGPAEAPATFVLVHGFTGSPAEMRPLGEALAARGYRALGIQLPGHGSRWEDLEGVRAEDWVQAVQEGVAWAHEQAEVVVLVGLSMGGLLTTVVVGERLVDVDAAVLLAPAYAIRDPLFPLVGLGRLLLRSVPAPALPRAGLTSTDGWKRLWHYDRRPVHAAWQLRRLQQRALRVIGDIDRPTLVAQGAQDLTLDPDEVRRIAQAIPNSRLVWLERSGHCLTADIELDLVMPAIEALVTSSRSAVSSRTARPEPPAGSGSRE